MIVVALVIELILILIFFGFLLFLKMKNAQSEKKSARLIAIVASLAWGIGAVTLPIMTRLLFIGKNAPAGLLMKGLAANIAGYFAVISFALSVFSVIAVWINYKVNGYELVLRRAMLPFIGFFPLFIALGLMFLLK